MSDPDAAKAFIVLPKRWIVGAHHRLAQPVQKAGKGRWECLNRNASHSCVRLNPPYAKSLEKQECQRKYRAALALVVSRGPKIMSLVFSRWVNAAEGAF